MWESFFPSELKNVQYTNLCSTAATIKPWEAISMQIAE